MSRPSAPAIHVTDISVLAVLKRRPGEWFSFEDVARELGHDPENHFVTSSIIFWFCLLCDQRHKLERKYVNAGRAACLYRIPPPPEPVHELDPFRDPVPP